MKLVCFQINTKTYFAFGSSAVVVSKNILAGRPYSGTAILCRNSIASALKLVEAFDSVNHLYRN